MKTPLCGSLAPHLAPTYGFSFCPGSATREPVCHLKSEQLSYAQGVTANHIEHISHGN